MARKYSNVSRVMNLTLPASGVDVTITVDDASGLPVTFPYALAIGYEESDLEIVLVTSAAGNVLSVDRGQEDTAAQPHSVGAVVVHAATALDFKNAADHIEADSNVHGVGVGSDVVGTDTVQTLTGKSMDGTQNTFTNIPASSIPGPFNNVTIGQAVASLPAVIVNPNATPTEDIIQFPYGTALTQDGWWDFKAKAAATYNTRWLNSGGTAVATMTPAGVLECDGVTADDGYFVDTLNAGASIVVADDAIIGGIVAIGSITPLGALSVDGDTFLDGRLDVTGLAAVVGDVNVGSDLTVTGDTQLDTATIADVATFSGSTTNITNPKSANAYFLRSAANFNLTADQASAGGAGSFADLAGCTTSVTIPTGYTGRVVVRGDLFFSYGVVATMRLFLNVAGVDEAKNTDFSPTAAGLPTTGGTGRTWVLSLAPGTYTIKLRVQNANGTATWTYKTSGTTMAVEVFY